MLIGCEARSSVVMLLVKFMLDGLEAFMVSLWGSCTVVDIKFVVSGLALVGWEVRSPVVMPSVKSILEGLGVLMASFDSLGTVDIDSVVRTANELLALPKPEPSEVSSVG